jgi:hypothetical protein
MPIFNEFRINKILLGEILLEKRKSLDSLHIEDDEEIEQFLVDLDEQNRINNKSLYVRLLEKFTKKNLVQFVDYNGDKQIREYTPLLKKEKPIIKLSKTIEPTLDFGDDINEWRNYIHEENIRDEEKKIEKEKMNKVRQSLVEIYSEFVSRKMMKIY